MRNSIKPKLAPNHNAIDKHMRLLLEPQGPRFVNRVALSKTIMARRVGNVYYSHEFAEEFFKVMLISKA